MSELTTVPAGAALAAAAPTSRPGVTTVGERGATEEDTGTALAAFAALLATALAPRPTTPADAAPRAPGAPEATAEDGGTDATGAEPAPVAPTGPPTPSGAASVLTVPGVAIAGAATITSGGEAVTDSDLATDAPVETTIRAAGDATATRPPDGGDGPAVPASGTPTPATPGAGTLTGAGGLGSTPPVGPTERSPSGATASSTSTPLAEVPAPRPAGAGAPVDVDRDVAVTAPAGPAAAAPANAGPDTAPAPVAASRELVGRVIDALDLLENAPPPRRMTIEVPDADGLRLHVSLRGSEVHVAVQHGGGGSPDLTGWGRELSAGLASRGFDLGGFSTDGRGARGDGAPRDDADAAPRSGGTAATDRGRPRPTPTTGLRL